MDSWDRAAQPLANDPVGLAALARRFLAARRDRALGLAPLSLLGRTEADLWALYWCAARRVDDSIEAGQTDPRHWRRRLRRLDGHSLADRCVHLLLAAPRLASLDVQRLLDDSLRGLEAEAGFDRPRPARSYRRLLEHKSTPTMRILDELMLPDEDPALVLAHARAFAYSTQVGDDCRDAPRDLGRGACFVTREEAGTAPAERIVQRPTFAAGRAATCRRLLAAADAAALGFVSPRARRRASALSHAWAYAIDTNQIRPGARHLTLPALAAG